MNLSVGIVGLANVGKSTLFNALLKKQQALAANYPFATIEPNIGVVPVPDSRLDKLAEVVSGELLVVGEESSRLRLNNTKPPIVPATVKFVDIAGLVAGASQGEGLGNKFLSHIREVDLICHVTRYFADSDVIHVAGNVDPARDRGIIDTELALADMQTLEKQSAPKQTAGKEEKERWVVIERLKKELNNGKQARDVLNTEEKELLYDLHLLTVKPVLQVRNVGEGQLTNTTDVIPGLTRDPLIDIDSRFRGNDTNGIIISARIESELAGLSDDEQREYLKTLGLEQSGLERLIQKAYERLGLISFLTAGVKEVRAWTITRGTKAPQAAGVIHTDFEKKFIKAEVISFDEFVAQGGWGKARETGKVRLEGKEYIMNDGDVVDFKIGA